jgi:CubicO group peptidase (beta-lactamase class C family)
VGIRHQGRDLLLRRLARERAAFDLDDPVFHYVPEFAAQGKEGITVRHLLTHTAGLTDPVDGVMPFGDAVAAVCGAPLVDGWTPGARRAYCSAGMWILSELVARRAGRPFAAFVREEIFEPLGMVDCWIGMPAEVFQACRDRIAVMPGFAASGTEEWVTWGRPTGGGHGPIGQRRGPS